MSIGRLLDISVRTMSAYQSAIDIASQNISNAGNADYTRQRVQFASEVGEGGVGYGVKVQDVMRIRNDILDSQLRKYQSSLSDANKSSEFLKQIEAVISEPSENGLSTYMNNFFNSWDELAANPNSNQLRLNVIQNAQELSSRFKDTMDGLNEVQYVLQQDAYVAANTINGYLKEIYELNQKIYDSESRGMNANELKDQRDQRIDQLSQMVNVSVQKSENGATLINVGGIYGADQTGYNEFETQIVNGQLRLVSKLDSNSYAIVNSGEFNAISDLYSNKIPAYKQSFTDLATSIIDQINSVHMTGYTQLSGGISSTGIPFFGEVNSSGEVINALVDGEMKINVSVLADPKNIAASSVMGNDGNSDIATKIAALSKNKISELGDQTISDFYNGLLNKIGQDKVIADNSISSNDLVVQNLESQKASNSGVSLDEEMANVLKYQRSYEASAKLIKMADELLNTIINLI